MWACPFPVSPAPAGLSRNNTAFRREMHHGFYPSYEPRPLWHRHSPQEHPSPSVARRDFELPCSAREGEEHYIPAARGRGRAALCAGGAAQGRAEHWIASLRHPRARGGPWTLLHGTSSDVARVKRSETRESAIHQGRDQPSAQGLGAIHQSFGTMRRTPGFRCAPPGLRDTGYGMPG